MQTVRTAAFRPGTQARYTIGSGMTIQENQPASQISAQHLSSYGAIYVMNFFGAARNYLYTLGSLDTLRRDNLPQNHGCATILD